MKRFVLPAVALFFLSSCGNKQKEKTNELMEKRITLVNDTLNVVKLSDTLMIVESTCRGCQYEGSTNFDIEDTTGTIVLHSIQTIDNNTGDVAGGNITKLLVLVPKKTGRTNIKMYKFWKGSGTAEDSARAQIFPIEVKN